MKRAAPPVHARLTSLLALVTVLAFLTAPLCAPLCAGKICAAAMTSSETHHESCHEMANIPANDDDHYIAPNKTCAATDFSAVLVTADDESSLLHAARSRSTPTLIDPSPAHGLDRFRATHERWAVHRVPLKSNDFLPLTTILRI
jgi:hypothetical protein